MADPKEIKQPEPVEPVQAEAAPQESEPATPAPTSGVKYIGGSNRRGFAVEDLQGLGVESPKEDLWFNRGEIKSISQVGGQAAADILVKTREFKLV
jgi:hypothetical protein